MTRNENMKHKKIQVYSDAAVYPHATGLGVVIKDGAGNIIAWRHQVMRAVRGSNEAEYHALIFALEQAQTFSSQFVDCFSDNKLVIEQMRGYYRVHDETLRNLHQRAQNLRDRFERVTFNHISRERNGLADAMAEEAIQQARERADAKKGEHTHVRRGQL